RCARPRPAPGAALGPGALAAASAGGSGGLGGFASDAHVIGESTLIAADLNEVIKLVGGRQRPAIHFASSPLPPTSEDNLSFNSGDTTVAFALAVSGGTVASMRDYRLAPLVWASGWPWRVPPAKFSSASPPIGTTSPTSWPAPRSAPPSASPCPTSYLVATAPAPT